MPTYLVKKDTWITHEGRRVLEGEFVEITWPVGAEPSKLGPNLELVESLDRESVPAPRRQRADRQG